MQKKTIKHINVKGKVCLMRVDFNVSQDAEGKILNDNRIRAVLGTLYSLIGRGAKIVLISHLGRPKDKSPQTSLRIVARQLQKYIQQKEIPLADLDDEEATKHMVDNLQNGEIMMFENTRWYSGEIDDPSGFGKYMSSFGDIFINDGFGVSHRKHASIIGIAKYLPSVAGLLMEEEIKYMELTVLKTQARPFVVIIGGKKAKEKIGVTNALLKKADDILLGGGIVNTYLKARGLEVGTSFYEPDMIEQVKDIMRTAMQRPCGLVVPKDFIVADSISPDARHYVASFDAIPKDMMTVDIGPETRKKYAHILQKAGFILWIGPMGVYEVPLFREGNDALLDAIAMSNANAFIGGGDTITSIAHHPQRDCISHVSTGGGATLKFLEQGTLPGIKILDDK